LNKNAEKSPQTPLYPSRSTVAEGAAKDPLAAPDAEKQASDRVDTIAPEVVAVIALAWSIVEMNPKNTYLVDGQSFEVEVLTKSVGEATVRVNRKTYRVQAGPHTSLSVSEKKPAADFPPSVRPSTASAHREIRAPMAGQILSIHVTVGDAFAAGAPLMVLDAMKMENTLYAPRPGRVETIAVRVGDTVLLGAPLLRLATE
jgi:glutaconyl-CoA/methylmalonyl-CoA decarboxylase subunit gamma